MPRRHKRHTVARLVKPVKYSCETLAAHYIFANNVTDEAIQVTDTITAMGTRKFKNFTIRLSGIKNTVQQDDSLLGSPYVWALVFVPQGRSAPQLNMPANSSGAAICEPNQNVIMSGVHSGTFSSSYKTRLARNCNSSDVIYLCIKKLGDWQGNAHVYATVNFAVCY